ncbi:hypothetical protein DCAR_0831870 [Daucus carota subsp. sativus]|uniref:DUF1990 domain-containing protein n=1 Tax=Daucus carota subsp. sativus TaxID=79200 RepID=A0AAF1BCT4_DAUCS|nr:PREDICTED: UPF0548 protein At2g17695 [Daucus carota subsp. sativus]WOH12367.1 hypothetical protein DCAR_0831870 [Daucus carota subsp. sativus]
MDFLRWACPSPEEQKSCINKSVAFNYDIKYKGASAKPASSLQENEELSKDGFFVNHAKVLLGSGPETYEKGKTALQTWKHFGMNWAFVDPQTPVQTGEKLCVCVKEIVPWIMMPLQVVFVNESKMANKPVASFSFGSGTLKGHLLAGEERFSVELDENNQVWYEILSFSKPDHFISRIGYPYARLRQKYFANQSSSAMQNYVSSN